MARNAHACVHRDKSRAEQSAHTVLTAQLEQSAHKVLTGTAQSKVLTRCSSCRRHGSTPASSWVSSAGSLRILSNSAIGHLPIQAC